MEVARGGERDPGRICSLALAKLGVGSQASAKPAALENPSALETPSTKAARYRLEAKASIEVAERMTLREDRRQMMEMAQRWIEMAQEAEAEGEAQDPSTG